jgi:hypothetical protein
MPLETLILTLRRQKVLLDADLAALYAVPTKALNQLQSLLYATQLIGKP